MFEIYKLPLGRGEYYLYYFDLLSLLRRSNVTLYTYGEENRESWERIKFNIFSQLRERLEAERKKPIDRRYHLLDLAGGIGGAIGGRELAKRRLIPFEPLEGAAIGSILTSLTTALFVELGLQLSKHKKLNDLKKALDVLARKEFEEVEVKLDEELEDLNRALRSYELPKILRPRSLRKYEAYKALIKEPAIDELVKGVYARKVAAWEGRIGVE